MNFEETLQRAKEYDKKAMLQIVEMYRPLMIKHSMVHEMFDEDLYQEHVYTMLKCIRTFSEDKYRKDK